MDKLLIILFGNFPKNVLGDLRFRVHDGQSENAFMLNKDFPTSSLFLGFFTRVISPPNMSVFLASSHSFKKSKRLINADCTK